MTTHQANPPHFSDLNDDFDEAHPNAHFSFDQRDSEEEKSNAHHRSSASGNEAPNSGSSTQDNTNSSNQNQGQPKRKELSSVFSVFYGVLLVMGMLGYVPGLFMMIGIATQGLGFDKFNFFVSGWYFVIHVIAFLGLWNKDLGKIEKALTMIKIYFPLMGVARLGDLFEAFALEKRYGPRHGSLVSDIFGQMVGGFILVYLFSFLPTRKVRNTWNTVIQEEEEKRKEQAQEADPIEKLDSLKFTIYKYTLLILICWEAKETISGIYEDFSDLPQFWGRMMSETSYLVMQIYLYPLFPLSVYTTFLAFEGLRRKSLEKVLTSIKLMKITLLVRLTMGTLTTVLGYYEGTLKKRYDVYNQRLGLGGEMENDDMLFFFGMSVLITALLNYICIYFTSQIRDILKAHQKSRHTL